MGEPNAILVCRTCSKKFDKGAPAQPGQDDSQYVCEDCQGAHNARALAAGAPTITIDGSK